MFVFLIIGFITGETQNELPAFFALSLMFFIGLGVERHIPDINIRGNQFRLRSYLHTSRWITWDEIKFVKQHFLLSSKRRKIYGIGVNDIGFMYQFVGFIQNMPDSAFLIMSQMGDFQEFMELLEQNRPDLFELNPEREINLP